MPRNRLKELRLRAGLSQGKLAEAVGTTAQQIGRLEMGSRQLSQNWMERLAKPLGCRPADFFPDAAAPAPGAAAPAPAGLNPKADADFFADVSEALRALYAELGLKISPRELAREAYSVHAELSAESALAETRERLLAEHLRHHRRFLTLYADRLEGNDRHSA